MGRRWPSFDEKDPTTMQQVQTVELVWISKALLSNTE